MTSLILDHSRPATRAPHDGLEARLDGVSRIDNPARRREAAA